MHPGLLLGLSLIAATAPPSSTWPELTTIPGGAGPGSGDAALVIGIGAYQHLPPLPGAADNARRIATWLTDGRGVPAARVTLLVDKAATGDAIKKGLDALARDATGVVWVVFIGHGAPHGNGDDGLILPVDVGGNRSAVDRFGIPQRDIEKAIDGPGHRAAVAIFDATFSRLGGDGKTPLVDGWEERLPRRGLRSPPRKTVVLAPHDGCAPTLPGAARPAFSYLLLGGLQGWADRDGDAVVDSDEVRRFLQESMPRCVGAADRVPPSSPGGMTLALGQTVRHRSDIQPALDAMRAPGATPAPRSP